MNNLLVNAFGFVGEFALLTGTAVGADTPRPVSDRVVVMISVDGLAGFYFDDPKAEMNNIHALAAAGARASGVVCMIFAEMRTAPAWAWMNDSHNEHPFQ